MRHGPMNVSCPGWRGARRGYARVRKVSVVSSHGTLQRLEDGCGVVAGALDEEGLAVVPEAEAVRTGPGPEMTSRVLRSLVDSLQAGSSGSGGPAAAGEGRVWIVGGGESRLGQGDPGASVNFLVDEGEPGSARPTRAGPGSAGGDQGPLRPDQSLPAQPEHPPATLPPGQQRQKGRPPGSRAPRRVLPYSGRPEERHPGERSRASVWPGSPEPNSPSASTVIERSPTDTTNQPSATDHFHPRHR